MLFILIGIINFYYRYYDEKYSSMSVITAKVIPTMSESMNLKSAHNLVSEPAKEQPMFLTKTKIKYGNNDVYEGEINDNYDRHGSGKFTCANTGKVYECKWMNDKMCGKVKVNYPNGKVYYGFLNSEGKKESGILTYSDGSFYKGTWKNGRRNKGYFVDHKGITYEFDWKFNNMDGKGFITVPNKYKLKCEFRDGKKFGEYMIATFDKIYYFGKYDRNGVAELNCTIRFPNNNIYVGEVSNRKMHGKGIMNYKNGDVYEGTWANGKRFGYGIMTYKIDGLIYEGQWYNDEIKPNIK